MDRLQGKTAIITGSSKGIGQGVALRFAREGANVIVNARSRGPDSDKTLGEIEALGAQGRFVAADVGSVAGVQQLFDESLRYFGTVDVLVNNAGIEREAPFVIVSEQDYDNVLNVNLKGVFFGTQRMAQHLIETKRPGSIIMMSSVHEELPFPRFSAYCASKGGMRMLTRTLAIELAEHGIRVNGIAPGAIDTPINKGLTSDAERLAKVLANIPLRRLGQPEDVAALAVFLASDEASYVTGSTYFVDGGLTWSYEE